VRSPGKKFNHQNVDEKKKELKIEYVWIAAESYFGM